MDALVLNAQKWLNSTYGKDSRYNRVTEDGYTGWETINGLTRAFQIELGITSTADNFGPSTISKFNAKFPTGIHQQKDDDDSEDNIYAIIQGALFCKGYATGVNNVTKHFYNGTGNAIKQLKLDAGCNDTSSTVTLNVMKALLSMDYFYSYDHSEIVQNIQVIQRYLNKNYESYTGLTPCDGIYNRRTNSALIYAIQAEEGMPVSVANANFGPSTKRCCPTIPYSNSETDYNGNLYSSTKIKKFIKLMKMGLYLNGVGTGDFSDNYDANLIRDFQSKYALSVSSVCNLSTWLSIFISCGDINRSALACDCATILTSEKAQTLYNNGYRYVGRYLSGYIASGASKALSISEMQIAFNNGLRIFPIHQGSANSVSYFTIQHANEDVLSAYEHAVNLGIPANTIIYFAVDCDPLDTDITNKIIPYFKQIKNIMSGKYFNRYKVGIYGTRNVCSKVCNAGYAVSSFVSDMSTGFSGNLGFTIPGNWAFDQFTTVTIGTGAGQIEIDKDGFSGRDIGIDHIEHRTFENAIENIEKVWDKAMNYTDNNISKSNELVLQYIRKDRYNGILWNNVAGAIDENFCNLIDNTYGKLDFEFNDPASLSKGININYDIYHLAATLNSLLFKLGDEENPQLDIISDLYSGWAGDAVSFTGNIQNASNNGETNLLQWAKDNICKIGNNTYFEFDDYICDIDALNIQSIIQGGYTLPVAIYSYFKIEKSGKTDAERRTSRWLEREGSDYLNDACNVIMADELRIFALLLVKSDNVNIEYINIALEAFKYFALSEYVNGR